MSSPENSSSEPEKSLPRHQVLGVLSYQCATCFSVIVHQLVTEANMKAGKPLRGHCSLCAVTVDLPMIMADCVIVPNEV